MNTEKDKFEKEILKILNDDSNTETQDQLEIKKTPGVFNLLDRFLKWLRDLIKKILKWLKGLFNPPEETEDTEESEETEDTGESEETEDTGESEETEDTGESEETEDTEETETTTTVEPCKATLEGPDCVCVDEVHLYKVTSLNCPGGNCLNWKVDKPSIARIIQIQNCEARVLVMSVGIFVISVEYLVHGQRIDLSKEIHAYKTEHLIGGTTNFTTKTTPLIQPHPFVQITSPAESAAGQCISASDYKVHSDKLDQGFPQFLAGAIELQEFINQFLEIEIKFSGAISDFFQETVSMKWKINEETEVSLLKSEEFTDSSFATKIPGENAMNPRVVMLRGAGEKVIKFIAENPIQRLGTDWATMYVGLKKTHLEQIGRLRDDLAVLIDNAGNTPHAGHAQAILNKRNEIKQAYLNALKNPCVECWHNHQSVQTFALNTTCKTRTKGENDDRGPTQLPATVTANNPSGQDIRATQLKKTGATLFLTDQPVKNYWVTKYTYSGSRYDWSNDGLLRGEHAHKVSSDFMCCKNEIDIFGVEAISENCHVINAGQTIPLKADGLPRSAGGSTGQYHWTVVAKPDSDAKAEIQPSGWTNSPNATLKVDTSGIYTLKVEYGLGRLCALTYALEDIKIYIKSAEELKWEIRRLGSYTSELAKHVVRPYYRERKQEELQAAEMLIRPKIPSVGPLVITMGKSFSGSFVILLELAFSDSLTVRVYYKDYSPNLTSDDYDDFSGPPYVMINPQSPMEASVELNLRKQIHAIHLINIRYKGMMTLKGQAVPIHFVYRPPQPYECDHDDSNSISTEEDTTTTIVEPHDLAPQINLLIYNRDLGTAAPSNGFQTISNAGDMANIPNGNLHLSLPVFSTQGHGKNLEFGLAYNSLQASYQDSLEMLQRFNGLRAIDIKEQYCESPIGKGWTHTYNIYLKEYIRPRDHLGLILDKYIELACPDGNRIQFKVKPSEGNNSSSLGPEIFVPEFTSEHWLGSAELGHSLTITTTTDAQGNKTYTLENFQHESWKFDKDGHLTSHSDFVIDNSQYVNSLSVTRSSNTLDVKDSNNKTLSILEPYPQNNYSGTISITHPDSTSTVLKIAKNRLTEVRIGVYQSWTFEYYDHLNQLYREFAGSFMRSVTDPLAQANVYEYYDGDWFMQIPKPVAKNFWGRIGRTQKGNGAIAREHLWRYKPLTKVSQGLVYRDPIGTEFVLLFRWAEMAIVKMEYVVQNKNPDNGTPLGTPNFEQALVQGNFDISGRHYQSFEYYQETKLLQKKQDLQKEKTTFEYEHFRNDTLFLLNKIIQPDGAELFLEYNARFRIEKQHNPKPSGGLSSGYVEYKYNSLDLLKEKIYPNPGSGSATFKEEWKYQNNTARIETHTDKEGNLWTYTYGDSSRDPHNTGQFTSRYMELVRDSTTTGRRTWEHSYDVMGNISKQREPLHGGETIYDYHPMGPIESIREAEITTAAGTAQSTTTTYLFDGLLNITNVNKSYASESWEYNRFGEVKKYTDQDNHATTYKYHKSGTDKKITTPDNKSTETMIDELSRIVRCNYPAPQNSFPTKPSEIFMDFLEYDDDAKLYKEKRYKVSQVSESLTSSGISLLKSTETTMNHARVKQTLEKVGPNQTLIAKTIYEYNAWGQASKVHHYDGPTLKTTFEFPRTKWGQAVGEIQKEGNKTRTRETVLTANGHQREIKTPAFTQSGQVFHPTVKNKHDELGRVLTIKDPRGNKIKQVHYHDALDTSGPSRLTEKGLDPSATVNQGSLVDIAEYHFNQRGLETKKYVGSINLNRIISKGYDGAGRLVEESDLIGRKRYMLPTRKDMVSYITNKTKQIASGTTWNQFDASNTTHLIDHDQTVFFDYHWNGQVKKEHTGGTELEARVFDTFGRVIEHRRKDRVVEKMSYDALGRLTYKTIGSDIKCSFSYDDENRQATGIYKNRHSEVELLYTFDWNERLKEYRYVRNMGTSAGLFGAGYHVKYDYQEFGDLKSKKYFRNAGQTIAHLEFGYNEAGMRTSMKSTITTGNNSSTQTVSYEYDINGRLKKLINGSEQFILDYNNAGLVKKFSRPMSGVATGILANTTEYQHNTRGELIALKEMAGLASNATQLSEMLLYYTNRAQESWEQARPWDISKKNIASDKSGLLRKLTYRRFFAEDASQGYDIDMYTQDLSYDGNGNLLASITQFKSNPDIFVDARYSQRNFTLTEKTSERIHSQHPYAGGAAVRSTAHQTKETSVFGLPSLVYRREGSRNSIVPKAKPAGYTELSEFYGPDLMLEHRKFVAENLQAPSNQLTSQPVQSHKRFRHDGLGRLHSLSDKTEVRINTNGLDPQSVPTTNQSYEHSFTFLYGPEGEEFLRTLYGQGLPNNNIESITLYDGSSKVAEYDGDKSAFHNYLCIPGIDVRLVAMTTDLAGNLQSKFHYRYDFKGATLFTTDSSGAIVTDYRLSDPEGGRDLFGRSTGPGGIRNAEGDVKRLSKLMFFYIPGSPRIDLMAASCHSMTERIQTIIKHNLHPAAANGARNNYGITSGHPHIWTTGGSQPEVSTPWTVAQSVVDFLRGMGDTISFGGTKHVREWIWGAKGEVIYNEAYLGGVVAGIGVSLALGYGVGSAAKAGLATGTAFRTAQAYLVIGDVVGVTHSSYSLIKGTFTPLDALGFIPAVGWSVAKFGPGAARFSGLFAEGFVMAPRLPGNKLYLGSGPGAFQGVYDRVASRASYALQYAQQMRRMTGSGRSFRGSEQHHIFSIYGERGQRFRQIFQRAGMDLSGGPNLINLPGHEIFSHYFRRVGGAPIWGHSPHYHQWVENVLRSRAGGNLDNLSVSALQQAVQTTLRDITPVLRQNPAYLVSLRPINALL